MLPKNIPWFLCRFSVWSENRMNVPRRRPRSPLLKFALKNRGFVLKKTEKRHGMPWRVTPSGLLHHIFSPPSTRLVSWILGVFQHPSTIFTTVYPFKGCIYQFYPYAPSPLCLPLPPPPPPPPRLTLHPPLLFRASASTSSLCAMSKPSSAPPASESSLPDATREEFLLHKAGQHSRQRRFDLALQDCEELLHLDGSHPQALRIKACVSEAHQEWGKAAYSYLEGLAGSPEDPVLRQGFDTALALIRTQSPKAQIKASRPVQPPFCDGNICSISGVTCRQG
jgi:hypothetical protein